MQTVRNIQSLTFESALQSPYKKGIQVYGKQIYKQATQNLRISIFVGEDWASPSRKMTVFCAIFYYK